MRRSVVCAAAATVVVAAGWAAVRELAEPGISAESACRLASIRRDGRLEVRIFKARRELAVFCDGKEAWRTRVALGARPVGDKQREGDGRTPEGEFYVCTRNSRSKFHRFLGLSYPGREDAERGLRDGLISRGQHEEIVRAIETRRTPPWKTPLGGEVGIHAGATSRDWTAGCISLDGADMEVLWELCPLGTPVWIEP